MRHTNAGTLRRYATLRRVLRTRTFPGVTTDLNFAEGWYYNQGFGTVSSVLSCTRASVGYIDDTSGNWTQIAANTLRISNKGALIEEARTNVIRNNSMQGAVAGVVGSGGSLPTNWSVFTANALTTTVIGTGVQNGVDYIDLQISGTPSGSFYDMMFDPGVTYSIGSTWALSMFTAMVGGGLTNIVSITSIGPGSGGKWVAAFNTTSTLTRISKTDTAVIANIGPGFRVNTTAGNAINVTLRIGWPQFEDNSINATVASATVSAGGSGYAVNDTITLTGGTGTQAILKVLTVSGSAVATVSVQSAGSYSVFPTSPASQGSSSGAGTGATFTLAPTDNSGSAFGTSPIRTTSAAATRSLDVIDLVTNPTFTDSWTLFLRANPAGITTSPIKDRFFASVTTAATYASQHWVWHGAASTFGANNAGTSASLSFAASPNTDLRAIITQSGTTDFAACINGGTVATGNAGASLTPTNLYLGRAGTGGNTANGYIVRVAIWPTTRLPNTTLQAITK